MTHPTWIDGQHDVVAGSIYFLVNHVQVIRGEVDHYSLSDTPAHSNGSHQPRLSGWCGTTDDIAVYACGLARVERFAQNGRMRIKPVDPASPDGQAALEHMGYPDLCPAAEAPVGSA